MNYYLHRLLYKAGLFKKINGTVHTRILDKKLAIPIINEMGYYHLLSSETWFIQLLQKILPGTTGAFVDVGMNIGQTFLKVKAVQEDRVYIGFEPNPACAYYCQKLGEKNSFTHYTIYPVGLYNQTTICTLYLDMDFASGASVLPEFRKNKNRYHLQHQVPMFTGDALLLPQEEKLGFLKADVEGAELEVLQGMQQLIERDRPIILLEILPFYDTVSENGIYRKTRMDSLLALLKRFQYNFYLIKEQDVSLINFDTMDRHNDMHKTNFLFMTDEQAAHSSLPVTRDETI